MIWSGILDSREPLPDDEYLEKLIGPCGPQEKTCEGFV